MRNVMQTIRGKYGVNYWRAHSNSFETWIQWRKDAPMPTTYKGRLLCDDGIIRMASFRMLRSGEEKAIIKVSGKTITGIVHSKYIHERGIACNEYMFIPQGKYMEIFK